MFITDYLLKSLRFIGGYSWVYFKLSHLDNRKSLRGFGTGRMPFSIELFSLTGKTSVGKMLGICYVRTLPVRASISIESMQKKRRQISVGDSQLVIVQNQGAVNSANFVNYVKKSDHLKCTPFAFIICIIQIIIVFL